MIIAIGIHYAGPHRQMLLANHGVDKSLKERILSSIRARLLDIVSSGSLETVQTCILLGTYYLYHGAPSLDLPWIMKKVTYFDNRLRQWRAELLPKLQWERVARNINYSSVEELDQDIGASGPPFENHIYQLQALTLMLAHGNSRILVNRPLLSYKLTTGSGTGKNGANESDSAAAANPLDLSLMACRDAALSMSEVASSSIVDLVSEIYAAEFVGTHTFTAGVTLGILASMDPLSRHLDGAKLELRQLVGIQDKLKTRSILAGQGFGIL